MKLSLPLAALILFSAPLFAFAASREAPLDARELAAGSNAFSLDLYAKLAVEKGNLFFSPHSIHAALAMTHAGARGQTADEMTKVLHLTLPPAKLHPAYGGLFKSLTPAPAAHNDEQSYQLVIANALWAQKDFPFHKDFQDLVKVNYQAALENVDYVGATEAARTKINQWVEKQTKEKIKDLIPPGVLNADTRLVLTNAIYFKAAWAEKFEKSGTTDADFHLAGGTSVKVPLMHQQERFGYAENASAQVAQLPYTGNELSMVILLPREKDGLAALEKDLTADNLDKWLKGVKFREVDLFLPRFKITSQFGLSAALKAMGMPTAFGDTADFSAMATAEQLQIQDVIHKAFVDVNEEGTEAAAATAVMMGATAMPVPQEPVTFRADHPFILLIRHERTGAILFIGRVANPGLKS